MDDATRLEREFANAILALLDHPRARAVIRAGIDTFDQAEFRRVMGWPIERRLYPGPESARQCEAHWLAGEVMAK